MKQAIKHIIYYQVIILMMFIFMAGSYGCGKKKIKHVKIGFVGSLTGPLSNMGIAGRDGVMLAVEQINETGGINGYPVELAIKDDKNDPGTALLVDRELITEGALAIIGHMTSSLSVAALPLINKEKIMMISPTTRTHAVTGIDDHFITITPHSEPEAEYLAKYTIDKMKLKSLTGIYDLSNRAYSEELYRNFKTQYGNMGGRLIFTTTFTAGRDVTYKDIAKILIDSNSEGVVIIASPLDTAMIGRELRKLDPDIPVISSAWGMASDLIKYGGPAVEGIIASDVFDYESKHKRFLTFKKQFHNRFGKEPDYVASSSYEAAKMLLNTLPGITDVLKLQRAITSQQLIPGLQENIRMDEFGDTSRSTQYILTVRNGKFKTLSSKKKKWY